LETLKWEKGKLILLDQLQLPAEVKFVECADWRCVASCIKDMVVRGAPAIGAAAAYGMVLAASELAEKKQSSFMDDLMEAASGLKATRPTAVNLAWAVERMLKVAEALTGQDAPGITLALEREANAIASEDVAVNRRIGDFGSLLVPDEASILTHCNAGALATVGYGTALGVVRSAVSQGKQIKVFADETRPYLQGARLTAWELSRENIPVTLIADNMAGFLMQQGKIDLVVVGADRIAANGDVANKIGTYSVAVLASYHRVPFYVAAPLSTFDLTLESGDKIPIEERCADEITHFQGIRVAPEGIVCYNPSFDVTPARLVSAIITEYGTIHNPDREKIESLLGGHLHGRYQTSND
jgi:methylthioribose-1-phosphate isomerase